MYGSCKNWQKSPTGLAGTLTQKQPRHCRQQGADFREFDLADSIYRDVDEHFEDDDDVELVETLLQLGTKPSPQALVSAVQRGAMKLVGLLLKTGASADDADRDGDSALLCAARYGDVAVLHALLQAGANPNGVRSIGDIALLLASRNGHTAVVRALLAAGANPSAVSSKSESALMCAAHDGHVAVVAALLKAGAQVDAVDEEV